MTDILVFTPDITPWDMLQLNMTDPNVMIDAMARQQQEAAPLSILPSPSPIRFKS